MHRSVVSPHVNGSHSLCPWSWMVVVVVVEVVSDQRGKFISRDRSSLISPGIQTLEAGREGIHENRR
jgi:hypothetical protein